MQRILQFDFIYLLNFLTKNIIMTKKKDLTINMENVIMYVLNFMYQKHYEDFIDDEENQEWLIDHDKLNIKNILLNIVDNPSWNLSFPKDEQKTHEASCPFCAIDDTKSPASRLVTDLRINVLFNSVECLDCNYKGGLVKFLSDYYHDSEDKIIQRLCNDFMLSTTDFKKGIVKRFMSFEEWIINQDLGSIKSNILTLEDIKNQGS